MTTPNGISYEIFQTAAHPGWDGKDESVCKAFGLMWFEERRSAILLVPSIAARVKRNILINPHHPDSAGITQDLPEPVWWDERLRVRTDPSSSAGTRVISLERKLVDYTVQQSLAGYPLIPEETISTIRPLKNR